MTLPKLRGWGFGPWSPIGPTMKNTANRPWPDIEAAAKAEGLEWVYMPVESGNITDQDVERFAPMIRDAEKPVLAFCRSGTRCTVLWALSSARDHQPEEILSRARNAGYDITGLIPRLMQQAGKR